MMNTVSMLLSLIALAFSMSKCASASRSGHGNPEGYYIVDSEHPAMFHAFCESDDETMSHTYSIICFRMDRRVLGLWSYGRRGTSMFMLVPRLKVDRCHILSLQSHLSRTEHSHDVLFYFELSLEMSLRLLREYDASIKEGDAADATHSSRGAAAATTPKASVPAFFHMESASVIITGLHKGGDNSNWEMCINIPSHICRATTKYKELMIPLFGVAHEKLLGVSQISGVVAERIDQTSTDDILEEFGIPMPLDMVKIAETYLNMQMASYHKDVGILIEQLVWERECHLVNEMKALFGGYTTYYKTTYRSIQKMVVMIMNGYYNLATTAMSRLDALYNLIITVPYAEKITRIHGWSTILNAFKMYLGESLEAIMTFEGLKALKTQIDLYQAAYAKLGSAATDAATASSDKARFVRMKQKLDEVINAEMQASNGDDGIVSTQAWFNDCENYFTR